MNKLIVAVKDTKAEAFMLPFFVNTKFEAQRIFSDAVNSNDANSVVCAHPEDFCLFELGSYDMVSGVIVAHEPVSLGVGIDFKKVD